MISSENPLYPIDVDDYPKLFDYVLTAEGLMFFQSLRRKYVLGKELVLDEYNKLRLLCIYYATANRNKKEVMFWQDLCVTLDAQGIFEKDMFQSKEDLIKNHLLSRTLTTNQVFIANIQNLSKRILKIIQDNRFWAVKYLTTTQVLRTGLSDYSFIFSIKAQYYSEDRLTSL